MCVHLSIWICVCSLVLPSFLLFPFFIFSLFLSWKIISTPFFFPVNKSSLPLSHLLETYPQWLHCNQGMIRRRKVVVRTLHRTYCFLQSPCLFFSLLNTFWRKICFLSCQGPLIFLVLKLDSSSWVVTTPNHLVSVHISGCNLLTSPSAESFPELELLYQWGDEKLQGSSIGKESHCG